MRIFIGFICLLTAWSCFSQANMMLYFPEYKPAFRKTAVLYRAYENKLIFNKGNYPDTLRLESERLSIRQIDDSTYVVRVNTTNRNAQITARDTRSNTIVRRWEFEINNFPSPAIYWGIYPPNSEITLDQTALRAAYVTDLFAENPEFEVGSCEISSPVFEKGVRFSNGILTQEVMDTLKKAKASGKGKLIHFDVFAKVKGKDGILRLVETHFVY